jgi:flagellar biosynthetic protein FliQ
MDTSLITDVLREGMWVVIQIAAPMLLLSMFVGIVLAVFQAVTQIHEQTLSFVFKLTVVVSILLLNGGWMMDKLIEYAESLYALIQA